MSLYLLYQQNNLPLDIWFKVSNTIRMRYRNETAFNWDFLDAGFNDPSRKKRRKADRLQKYMEKCSKARRH
jgi:hypothetical protein